MNVIRNPAALSYWRRQRKMESRGDEDRPWILRCPSCEHSGIVNTTLKKLRTSNLKCSACGAYLWHRA